MKLILSALLLGWVALAPATSFGQEAAGRVLAVAGNVTIERGAQRNAAQAGTEVRTGDTFLLGPQSNAQIRFTDESIVALGSDTTFRVSEYAFQGRAPEAQRSYFELVKGGMRTVTGLIGRARRDNYGLRTASATIGIRGTAFAACQDCVSVRGEPLPGTSVGFTEGAGFIRNQGGELQLTAGESAYAPSTNSNPVRTLSFPRTQQEARVRPTTSQQAQAEQKGGASTTVSSATTAAQAGDSGGSALAGTTPGVTTIGPPAQPVFQVTSTPSPETILAPSFTGTAFYRLAGPFNIPTSCAGPPCGSAVAGEFTLGVNYSLQRATASAAFKLDSGEIFNLSIPINISGVPVSINGGQTTFSGTFNLADFPQNNGSFSCSECGPGGTQGFATQITISGTINGSQATVTFGATNVDVGGGGSGSVTATLTQQAPPNNAVAALASPVQAGGTDSRSASFWNVKLDASGRLQQIGPVVGEVAASVGGATNTIVGTAPSAGNLVWGTWTNGTTGATKATITDNNYATFQPANGSVQPWITGEAPNSLPPSLGTLTFTPAGAVFSGANQVLNSGSLTADFVNRSMSLALNATNTGAGNTFQMNATTGFSPTTGRFSGGFNSVTCSGPCVGGTPSGSFGGFFSGAQAQGAGVAFSAGFGLGTGVTGAVAFKR